MKTEEELKNMSVTELAQESINMSIKTIIMAFIEGFKLSAEGYNWEIVQYDIEDGLRTIEGFYDDMSEEFKKICGLNE